MTSKPSEPKDLGVKIGSPEEVFWTNLQEKLVEDNLNHRRQILINDVMIGFTKAKQTKEKEKFK